jgi:hypothetical protein
VKLFLFILLLSPFGLSVDRPSKDWAIYSVKCDDDGCYENLKQIYDVRLPAEAVKLFQEKYPDLEIRCIARDYYYSSCNPRW